MLRAKPNPRNIIPVQQLQQQWLIAVITQYSFVSKGYWHYLSIWHVRYRNPFHMVKVLVLFNSADWKTPSSTPSLHWKRNFILYNCWRGLQKARKFKRVWNKQYRSFWMRLKFNFLQPSRKPKNSISSQYFLFLKPVQFVFCYPSPRRSGVLYPYNLSNNNLVS